jgi:hypothetical protein
MGGKGVTEEVGINAGVEAGDLGRFFDDAPKMGGRKAPAMISQKNFTAGFGTDQFGTSGIEVAAYGLFGGFAQQYESLLVAFTDDPGTAGLQIELFDADCENFGGPQSGGVEKFEEGSVAQAERGFD